MTWSRAKKFLSDRSGNVALLFALACIPLFLTLAVTLDYSHAALLRGRLADIADAAALTATTPAMMTQSPATAKTAAITMFQAQASAIKGFTYKAGNLTVTVSDTSAANTTTRNVTVTYSASVISYFGNLAGKSSTAFNVTSTALATSATNINFYLLLDVSPSMEIPATSAGIAAMVANTGCALACHESDFTDSDYTVHYPGWGSIDSYAYAENSGITLRIDNLRSAAQSLLTTAQSLSALNGATYQLAAYTFDSGVDKLFSLTPATSANQSSLSSALSGIMPKAMVSKRTLSSGLSWTYPTSGSAYDTTTLSAATDVHSLTNFGYASKYMNQVMATPGNGTKVGGDTPQGVLMIVTDGLDDATLFNSSSCNTSYFFSFSNAYGSFVRCQQPMDVSQCAAIKARGIRIAVLYTTYFPLTGNAWYDTNVAPFISQVPDALQACASSTNLFAEVNTDGDITVALQKLFYNAVASAPRLTQ